MILDHSLANKLRHVTVERKTIHLKIFIFMVIVLGTLK